MIQTPQLVGEKRKTQGGIWQISNLGTAREMALGQEKRNRIISPIKSSNLLLFSPAFNNAASSEATRANQKFKGSQEEAVGCFSSVLTSPWLCQPCRGCELRQWVHPVPGLTLGANNLIQQFFSLFSKFQIMASLIFRYGGLLAKKSCEC